MMQPPMPSGRLAILHDMAEEAWPSMDQMGDLLTTRVPLFAPGLSVTPIRHRLVPLASIGPLRGIRPLFLADRIVNRMLFYPAALRRRVRGRFDLYHVVDHSYAQLALELPGDSTIVTCHDVETFRSLIQPDESPRPAAFRMMTGRILRGLARAGTIVCGSAAARDDLVRFGLADPARTRVVPNGIDPRFLEPPGTAARARAAELLPLRRGGYEILHVGHDVPRKRLDRLIGIVAALQARGHQVRLVRVGAMRAETRRRAAALGFADFVELPFLDAGELRAVYERADVLLLPSDREGYGLPVLEAFASGKPVVASDIPALRESSGGLAACVPPDDLGAWVDAVERVMSTADGGGLLAEARRRHAASRTWDTHVRDLIPIYGDVLERARQAHRQTSRAGSMAAAADRAR